MWLCDRCADRRIAKLTGWLELPDPPGPVTFRDPDGHSHDLRYRTWRAPTGIEVELEATGVTEGEGFHFAVLGAHDADVDTLIDHVTATAEREIGRRYLVRDAPRAGWTVGEGDEVAGRLVEADDHQPGDPYEVIVDGRTLTWEQLGHALAPYNGWRFRLILEDRCDDFRPDATIVPLSDPDG